MPPTEALGGAILALRRKAGLTQEELGKRVGASNTKIADYEAGRTRPSLVRLWGLLEAMGVDFVDFGYAVRRVEGRAVPEEARNGGSVFTPEQLKRLDEEAHLTAYSLTVRHLRSLRGQIEPDPEDTES